MSNDTKIRIKWFLAAVILMACNDHYLKYEYPSWITGKLSDAAGLFAFPVFISFFMPGRRYFPYFITALIFIWWKSPFSGFYIDFINSFSPFLIARTIDYTDLFCLPVLPLAMLFFERESENIKGYFLSKSNILMIAACFFVFCSTTVMQPRPLIINATYKVKMKPDEILQRWAQISDSIGEHLRIDTIPHQHMKMLSIADISFPISGTDSTTNTWHSAMASVTMLNDTLAIPSDKTYVYFNAIHYWPGPVATKKAYKKWFRHEYIEPLE